MLPAGASNLRALLRSLPANPPIQTPWEHRSACRVNFRKYLVLAAMVVFGAVGDVSLSRGMKNIGAISLAHWIQLIPAVFNPWVALGIAFLLVFFVFYSTALSW